MKNDCRITLKLPSDLSKAVRDLIKADSQHTGWTAGTAPYCCALIADGMRFRSVAKHTRKENSK